MWSVPLWSTLVVLVPHAVDAAPPEPPTAALVQDDAAEEATRVRAAIGVLRNRRSTEEDRAAATEELLELGTRGPTELARHLASELERLHKSNAKEVERVLGAFDKDARKLVEKRLDRKAREAVDEHRAVLLRNARDETLTKERIQSESDPALKALEELLTVKPSDVWEAEEKLAARWFALLDEVEREAALIADWQRAHAALVAAGGQAVADKLEAPDAPIGTPDELIARLAVRADLARMMSDADRRVMEENAVLAAELRPGEAEGVRHLNLIRVLLGLNAQGIDVKLCEACRDHSQDMRTLNFFAHESPVEGKKTFGDRASRAGTSASAENIAVGAEDGPGVIRQWWYSPGHHRNMLGGQARVGLGRDERHWTQNFG